MIRAILSIFLTLYLFSGASQTLSLAPNPVSITVNANDTDVPAKAVLVNNSDKTVEYIWTRNIVSLTSGWETAVCDFNLCYNPTVDSMSLTLAPNEESNMDIHIYPNGVVGEAEIELTIKEKGVDTNFVKGTYLFNVTTPVKKISSDQIAIFPNPSTEYFQLNSNQTVAKIEVIHLSGNKVKTFYAYNDKRYYVGDLSNGMYFVKLLDINNNQIKAVRLNKR